MSELIIWACCYSTKEDVSISFGTTISSDAFSTNDIDADCISEGLSDSFWENYSDFEEGINKAKELQKENAALTDKEALYQVFGEFSISFEVNGQETELALNQDINDCIYSLLME